MAVSVVLVWEEEEEKRSQKRHNRRTFTGGQGDQSCSGQTAPPTSPKEPCKGCISGGPPALAELKGPCLVGCLGRPAARLQWTGLAWSGTPQWALRSCSGVPGLLQSRACGGGCPLTTPLAQRDDGQDEEQTC